MERPSELLLELLSLVKYFSPKSHSPEYIQYTLANGPCYHVSHLIGEILRNEGHDVKLSDHGHHAWFSVDGVAYDSLNPFGYKEPVWDYWLMNKIFPKTEVDCSVKGRNIESGEYLHSYLRYLPFDIALSVMAKKYGLKTQPFKPQRYNRFKLRKANQKLRKLHTVPLNTPMFKNGVEPFTAFFWDCLEEVEGKYTRPLKEYPYSLGWKWYKVRLVDLKKRNIPIKRM